MKRRLLLTMPLWLSLGSAGSALAGAGKPPGYTVSADQLQQAVAKRFPLRYPVGGLLDLNLQTPRLRLLPDTNRLAGAGKPPGYTVSADQLQQAVAKRFPLRYPVGGLLDLNLQTPRLRLLPDTNRLATDMVVQAAGPVLGRSYSGTFEVDFGLRYEASDQTLRAQQLRVNALHFADLPPGPAELLNAYGPALAEKTLQDVVLHQLRPQDLALPDAMGLQPDRITVTRQGLAISFINKPLR